MDINERVKYLRKSMNISQKELAKKININTSVMNRIESGERRLRDEELVKLSKIFGVTNDYLLGRTSNIELNCSIDICLNNKISFSDNLRNEREKLGLLQKEMAKKLGLPSNTYNGYETGKRSPNLEVAAKIADCLNVPIDYLLGNTTILNSGGTIGNKLKELRKSHNLTQEDVAKKIGLTKSAYGYYEQGKTVPDAYTLSRLADCLNVSSDCILGRVSNMPTNIKNNLKEIINDLKNTQPKPVFYGNTELDDEELNLIEDAMDLLIKTIKFRNKEKSKKDK